MNAFFFIVSYGVLSYGFWENDLDFSNNEKGVVVGLLFLIPLLFVLFSSVIEAPSLEILNIEQEDAEIRYDHEDLLKKNQ